MRSIRNVIWLVGIAALAACASKTDSQTPAATSGAGQTAPAPAAGSGAAAVSAAPAAAGSVATAGSATPAAAASGGTCVRSPDCLDIMTSFFSFPGCCTQKYACGYEVSFAPEFLAVYPMARDLLVELTADDPNGKCANQTFVFPVKPGTYDHRVELPGPPENDILIDAKCESRGITVFSLPGCCMPDNRCGISTDEMAPQFQVLLEGETAPFTEPECVTADVLNQQIKATKLSAFARIPATTGAACDYAGLAARIPRYKPTMAQP